MTFQEAPDYENPLDSEITENGAIVSAAEDNVYVVDIIASSNGAKTATQSVVIEVTDIQLPAGFTVDGVSKTAPETDDIRDGDESGYSVSSAGDFNGDGIGDVIIGIPGGQLSGDGHNDRIDSGLAMLIFGKEGEEITFNPRYTHSDFAPEDGILIIGPSGATEAGVAVAGGVDFNNDGVDDIIISAPGAGADSARPTGHVYVLYGQQQPAAGGEVLGDLDLSTLTADTGFTIVGRNQLDAIGNTVASVGDVNGDGVEDIILGGVMAPNSAGDLRAGQSYVVFGKSAGTDTDLNLSDLNGINGFAIDGEEAFDKSGISMSGIGDINGDSIDDFIIGASGNDHNGDQAGRAYVVYGKDTDAGTQSFDATLDFGALDGANGFRISGLSAGDQLGHSVSGVGDIDGDNIADFAIGAPGADGSTGHVYVFFGQETAFDVDVDLNTLNGENGFVVNGAPAGSENGFAVSGAGDVNGDGVDDLIISAPNADGPAEDGSISVGRAYVIFGRDTINGTDSFASTFDLSTLNGHNGFQILGHDDNDNIGFSLSSAGNINGDSFDDLIIGAPSIDDNTGQTYVLLGQDLFEPIVYIGDYLPDM